MSDHPVVLVVEDEALLRIDIHYELMERGFEVFEAGNAREAIAILDANASIAILFTDIDMPGTMDGLMLAAAVRYRWPPIKIIVTSGQREVDVGDMPKGCRFFRKPYAPEAISHAMRLMVR